MKSRMDTLKQIAFVTILSLILISCKNPKNYDFIPTAAKLALPLLIKVNTADELASASSENYDDNRFGLITARTLNNLVSNWDSQRPTGITGKLVIIQVDTTGTPNGRYSPTSPARGVYTYYLNYNSVTETSSVFGQSRLNGVIETESMVPEGKLIDGFLATFGINPNRDLIVIASDSSNQSTFLNTLRLVYALRYWGIDKKNVALLNGSVRQANDSGEIFTVTSRNTEIKQEFVSVRTSQVDSTILQATLGDVIHILQNGNTTFEKVTPVPANGVQFVDARTAAEYTPANQNGITPPPTGRTCVAGSNCKVPFEGRIKGAVNLTWSSLVLDSTNNDFRFKTKANLQSLFSSAGISGSQQIITYCDRGSRSAAVLFAAGSILGYASRLYDASWIEWSALAVDENAAGWSNLIGSSPWRTDRASRTDNLTFTSSSNNIVRFTFQTSTSFSTTANKVIDADKDYIRGTGGSSGGGSTSGGATGGGGNACGG
jgi:thiosulfate/3-mercaptopyruvate sulfurtransferase